MAIIGLIILQLITISKVSNLEVKIQNMQSQLNSERNDLRNEMSSISSRIKNELEQQSSILDSFEYEIGMLDEETLSAPVTFRVVPKQKSQGMIAELYYGDRTVEMQAQGAGFTTTFDIGLFEEEDCRINLSAAGTDNIESLDFEPREIRRKYLPSFYAFYHDFGQGTYENGAYQTEGIVDINVKPDGIHGITIESVELIVTLDGNVISHIEPSLEKESTE
ncbi:hypothetical protein JR334_10180 [Clostridia bacterium]|nr:hypothetical protein JR334_10180 [Clostridia bacterium]